MLERYIAMATANGVDTQPVLRGKWFLENILCEAPPPPPRKAKLTYKDQRDYELLPKRIEELAAAIARDETALADAGLYARDPARFAGLTRAIEVARADKDAAEERWLELAELVEG